MCDEGWMRPGMQWTHKALIAWSPWELSFPVGSFLVSRANEGYEDITQFFKKFKCKHFCSPHWFVHAFIYSTNIHYVFFAECWRYKSTKKGTLFIKVSQFLRGWVWDVLCPARSILWPSPPCPVVPGSWFFWTVSTGLPRPPVLAGLSH